MPDVDLPQSDQSMTCASQLLGARSSSPVADGGPLTLQAIVATGTVPSPAGIARLAVAVGGELLRMHRTGVAHGGLDSRHVLVHANGTVSLVPCEAEVVGDPDISADVAALMALVAELIADEPVPAGFARFMMGACPPGIEAAINGFGAFVNLSMTSADSAAPLAGARTESSVTDGPTGPRSTVAGPPTEQVSSPRVRSPWAAAAKVPDSPTAQRDVPVSAVDAETDRLHRATAFGVLRHGWSRLDRARGPMVVAAAMVLVVTLAVVALGRHGGGSTSLVAEAVTATGDADVGVPVVAQGDASPLGQIGLDSVWLTRFAWPDRGSGGVPEEEAEAAWRAVVAQLDAAREDAFGRADPALLVASAVPGSPADTRDRELIGELQGLRARAQGLRTEVLSVVVLKTEKGAVALRVKDRRGPYQVVSAIDSAVLDSEPARPVMEWKVKLVDSSLGWRFESATAVPS